MEHAQPVPAGAAPDTPRHHERSAKDMALSLLVLLIPVALIIGTYRVLYQGDQPVLVDPRPVVAEAAAGGRFPVALPTGLGQGWRVVSARYVTSSGEPQLRLGYLAPGDDGVQLIQRGAVAGGCPEWPVCPKLTDRLAEDLGPQPRLEGPVAVAGATWQLFSARPGEHALVFATSDRTVVVVGAAPDERLREIATALARAPLR